MTQSFKIVLKNKQHDYAYWKHFFFYTRLLYFVIYFHETCLRRVLVKIHVAITKIRQRLVRGKRNNRENTRANSSHANKSSCTWKVNDCFKHINAYLLHVVLSPKSSHCYSFQCVCAMQYS